MNMATSKSKPKTNVVAMISPASNPSRSALIKYRIKSTMPNPWQIRLPLIQNAPNKNNAVASSKNVVNMGKAKRLMRQKQYTLLRESARILAATSTPKNAKSTKKTRKNLQ